MVSEQPTRVVEVWFRKAGWRILKTDGRHTKYGCPCGAHSFPLPSSHRTISPGVVRKAQVVIEQCKEASS
ncbi:hypothetical protein EPD65_04360 [Nocardioides jejuensis]|uniref:Type II toxin-antitoxin system HicA family toxin n=1 Tax=Nocardioides jejuensis TaxID=2502782 RepID=A0A4R1CI53_9ACTN|nr:hypothetical protein EPD65_04360 [Nocardioides jejuensis]